MELSHFIHSALTLLILHHFQISVFVLKSVQLIRLWLQLILNHKLITLSLLMLFFNHVYFTGTLHDCLLDHLNTSLERSIFSDETFTFRFFLSLENLIAHQLLFQLLNRIFDFSSFLFQSTNLHFLLRIDPDKPFHITLSFL